MTPSEKLRAWLKIKEIAPAAFARRVDYDRSNFHRIITGTAKPSLDLALRIERETGGDIPMSAWAEAKAAA